MSRALDLSAFIICFNEESYIGNCLESLSCCSDIVVVDSGSTDATLDIVRAYREKGLPIRLFSEAWRGYAAQKQFALEQCTRPWCINLDADERLDEAFLELLPALLAAPAETVGWRIARRPYLIGYGYTPEKVRERQNLRLIRNGMGGYDLSQAVHEGIVPKGRVEKTKTGSILHYRPLIMDEQILKENRYSTLKADQQFGEGRKPALSKLVFSPLVYFLRLYLHNGLWRCGVPGFIEAMTGGVYAFLTQAKLYQRHALVRSPNLDTVKRKGAAR